MYQEGVCPVCGRHGLTTDCEQCPQCDADLTCFQALDSLSDQHAASGPTTKRSSRFPVMAAVVLLTLIALVLAVLLINMKKNLQELDQRLTELKGIKQTGQGETTVGHTEDLARIREKLTASSGIIYQVDAQIRIMDDSDHKHSATKKVQETVENSDQGKKQENSLAGHSVPRQQIKEEKTAAGLTEEKKEEDLVVESKSPVQTREKIEAKSVVPPKKFLVLKAGKTKRDLRRKKTSARKLGRTAAQPKKLPVLKDAPSNTVIYQAGNTDTLWDIAERFYGNGKYYPVIMEQNPHLRINNINSRSRMRLFTDRHLVAEIYKRKKEWRKGLLLWKYEVQPGETWNSIYNRFFSPDYSGRVFYARNPHIFPGNTVRIVLH